MKGDGLTDDALRDEPDDPQALVDVGAVTNQKAHHGEVQIVRRQEQGAPSVVIAGIGIHTLRHEPSDHCGLPSPNGIEKFELPFAGPTGS